MPTAELGRGGRRPRRENSVFKVQISDDAHSVGMVIDEHFDTQADAVKRVVAFTLSETPMTKTNAKAIAQLAEWLEDENHEAVLDACQEILPAYWEISVERSPLRGDLPNFEDRLQEFLAFARK